MTERCANCRFFHATGNSKPVCRRYPPTLWKSHNINDPLFSAFPNATPKAWCGEWKALPEPIPEAVGPGSPGAAARAFAHGRKRRLEVV